MNDKKTFVVLGLGRFGSTLATQLSSFNQDVIAIDKDLKAVERISPYVSSAICFDYSDIEALKQAGVMDADVGIISTGTMLDQEIMGVMNLKELGVPFVLAKANDVNISKLLLKVGADETITPEIDTAKKCAKKLISKDILDLLNLGEDYTVLDVKVLKNWIGHNLKELDLRHNFSINVIGVKRGDKININFSPDEKFIENDQLILVGPNDVFEKFSELKNI